MPPKTAELVKSLGFPVVASIALGWFIVDTRDTHSEERIQWRTEHKQERQEWKETMTEQGKMNRNTSEKLTDAVHALEMTIAEKK